MNSYENRYQEMAQQQIGYSRNSNRSYNRSNWDANYLNDKLFVMHVFILYLSISLLLEKSLHVFNVKQQRHFGDDIAGAQYGIFPLHYKVDILYWMSAHQFSD